MTEGGAGPSTPKLRIAGVLRVVWRVYRRRWWLLVPLAIVVLLPQALADAAFGEVEIERLETVDDLLRLASIPLSVGINLGGEALYAGLVASFVVEWLGGRELRSLRAAVSSIAFGQLIALDLILALGTVAGLVLLIIPGLVFYAYMYVSPALIELNGMRVREAMRGSVELVRGSFWRVLVFSLIVIVLSEGVVTAFESPLHGLTGELLFNVVVEALVEPFQGLTTVFLALALLDLHGRDKRYSAFAESPWPASGRG